MLPLSRESYKRVLGSTDYNIFNNSNIKAVFLAQNSTTNLTDTIYRQSDPYTYIQGLTSSPSRFSFDSNLRFEFVNEDPGNFYTTDVANQLNILGKITIDKSDFTADGTTDQFVIIVDEANREVVSYVKLNADTSNTVMNNITQVQYTDDIMNVNDLYSTTEFTLSAGMEDFIQGAIDKDDLRILFLKDKDSDSDRFTYSTILSCSTIEELSTMSGGDRIKVISKDHGLNNLNFRACHISTSFSMSLTCSETVIASTPATQGFSPPYRGLLYDVTTSKPLLMFSEALGIEGQDNIFIKANGTSLSENILNAQPGN